ncbi:hypothetical protein Y032_0159g3301 [Ancylostoma ceylanicum]|nr:hypothetical protein Y032_0159g3301 [Ancylostoma ceylanicum]
MDDLSDGCQMDIQFNNTTHHSSPTRLVNSSAHAVTQKYERVRGKRKKSAQIMCLRACCSFQDTSSEYV